MLNNKDIIQRSLYYVAIITIMTIISVGLAVLNEELFASIANHNLQIIIIASFILILAVIFQYKQTGIALENAKLYKVLQEKQDVLDRDLRMARSLQQGLIPDRTPQIPGFVIAARCLPAESVGGDFYNFLQKDNELDIVIGDVSGHGVSSALVMALTNGIINELGQNSVPPGEMLADVNRHIQYYLSNNINFVTAFYSRLDIRNKKLSFSKAGHLPALLFKNNAKKPSSLDGEGILLGVFADAAFSSTTVDLEAGDKVIFYTDGITEIRNPAGEWYGEDRLIDLISANKTAPAGTLLETIFTEIKKFSGLQRDDQTMVILEVQ